MIVCSRAPVRIDLAGGWTDVPPFADREGGAVVNVALSHYTYASVQPRDEPGVRIKSGDYDAVIEAPDTNGLRYDGTLDLVKAALRAAALPGGLHVMTHADTPPGSGLGTSAALGVALTGALNILAAERLSAHEVAATATRLEVEELGIAGGKQDQLAAALGGINYMQFGAHPPIASRLAVDSATRNELERRLVLCYSGISRLSGDIIERVQRAYNDGQPATCEALRTMRDLARRCKSILLRGELGELGPLLRRNWECQKQLHPSVTNADVERLFAVAERSGALGGKACGAGGGGCLVFWSELGAEHELRRALAAAGALILSGTIDGAGLQTWHIDAHGRVH